MIYKSYLKNFNFVNGNLSQLVPFIQGTSTKMCLKYTAHVDPDQLPNYATMTGQPLMFCREYAKYISCYNMIRLIPCKVRVWGT